jgi:large subunit ribosomal protein L23
MIQKKGPYSIVTKRYVTEKANVLADLHTKKSNKSLNKCENPKAVYLVDPNANKLQIASAIEKIYDNKVSVVKVNTINTKPKQRRVRGHVGYTKGFKKAIVTFEKGDVIDVQA